MGKNTVTHPDIDAAIKKSIDIGNQFTELTNKLQDDLAAKWKSEMGVDMPTATEADVRSVKVFAQYSKGLNVKPYIEDVNTLVNAATNPNVVSKVKSIASVVGNVIEMAIGNITVSANITSNSVKIRPQDGDPFIIGTYINVVQADSSRFGVTESFNIVAFAFIIWTPKSEAHKALLKIEEFSD